jgi:hypothetical protein
MQFELSMLKHPLAFLALCLGCIQAHTAAAVEVRLRTLEPKLVCAASENYCKVSVKVAYSYPGKPTRAQAAMPVECIATVAVKHAPQDIETVESYRRSIYAPVNYGTIDEEMDVMLKPSAGMTSMQLKSVGCTGSLN